MKCKRCRREITENSLYCSWCGAKQITDGLVNVPKPKRQASGEYVGRVMVDGVRERIKATTEAEYYRRARAIKLKLVDLKNEPSNFTLDDVIKGYIEKNEPVFSPSTVRGYETIRRQLQKFTSDKVKSIDWQDLVNQLSAKFAPKTVKNQYGLIVAALKAKKITPPDVKLPQTVKSERPFLEPNDIKLFVSAIRGKRIELTALLALHSLRESEILALTKDSVKDGIIHVKGAVVPNKENQLVRKQTNKTTDSAREIPIFIPRLAELWGQLETDPQFPHPSEIRRQLLRVCRRNALPDVTCHGLRHSFCSLAMGEMGWDIKTTQRIGGWASPSVPTQVYTHLCTNRYEDDVKRMENFYKEQCKK